MAISGSEGIGLILTSWISSGSTSRRRIELIRLNRDLVELIKESPLIILEAV
jgi:hypothetical protein